MWYMMCKCLKNWMRLRVNANPARAGHVIQCATQHARGLPAGLWRFKYVAANLMAYEIFLETEKQHGLKPAATAIATSQQLPAPAQQTPPPRNTIAATHEHIISNTHKRLTGSRGSYPQRESAGGA
jgi:hypothetical protein